MQVRYDEGVAIHIGPEPCVAVRKGGGEASVGERIGQLLSIIKIHIPGADTVAKAEGNSTGMSTRAPGRPGVVEETGMCRRSLPGNREIPRMTGGSARSQTPPYWLGSRRTKRSNPLRRSVERRVEAKGNTGQQSTYWAQDRESVSQALDRIRKVARHRKKEKFTSLFHHITVRLLREAFFELKENAAPGVDGLTQVRRAAAPARGCRPGRQNRPEGDCRSAKRDL